MEYKEYELDLFTPTVNVLEALNLDLNTKEIINPFYDKGIISGISCYTLQTGEAVDIIGTDIKEREVHHMHHGYYDNLILESRRKISWEDAEGLCTRIDVRMGKEYNFLSEDYPIKETDYIIMHPPYYTIQDFITKGLAITRDGLLLFSRLLLINSGSDIIFKDNPPTDVYACNYDMSYLYAWFYWDKHKKDKITQLHWTRRE